MILHTFRMSGHEELHLSDEGLPISSFLECLSTWIYNLSNVTS